PRAGPLPGAERQMLPLGRALMMSPSVLLLDEPSAGLSPALQDQVFVRCRRINQEGVGILVGGQTARGGARRRGLRRVPAKNTGGCRAPDGRADPPPLFAGRASRLRARPRPQRL